jgi:hypothetical protein
MDTQWRKAVAKVYNLPINCNTEKLMKATLQPQPAQTARKHWIRINSNARRRGEDIAKKAKVYLRNTEHMGPGPLTDQFIAKAESTSHNVVAQWRKLLQQKKYRPILKLRAGNLAQPRVYKIRRFTTRMCPCGMATFN